MIVTFLLYLFGTSKVSQKGDELSMYELLVVTRVLRNAPYTKPN